jgi:amino acid permease
VIAYAFIDELQLCDERIYDSERFASYCTNNEIYAVPALSAMSLLNFFKSAPVIILSYTGHDVAFTVVNELKHSTRERFSYISLITVSICFILYGLVAFCGYYSFGVSTPANVILAYPRTTPILVLRLCLSFAIAFSYPVVMYPLKTSTITLLLREPNIDNLSRLRFHLVTWTLLVLSYIVAMCTDDLGVVFGLVGSAGSTLITFCLPGLFYVFYPSESMKKSESSDVVYRVKYYFSVFVIFLGCLLIPFGIVMQFATF